MSKKTLHKKSIGNNLNLAIEQVETYICHINPKNYQDIKIATRNISKAALGAYLSVHSISETLDFINQLAHSIIDDVADCTDIPATCANSAH